MNQNRRQTENGTWIVHEGLQNHPDIKEELENLSIEMNDVALNKTRHLSDSAIIIADISDRLNEVSKKLFNLHDTEKKEGVKETK